MPPDPGNVSAEETEPEAEILDGLGARKALRLSLGPEKRLFIRLELSVPKGKGPFPAILINRRATEKSRLLPENLAASLRRGYLVAEYRADDLQADETSEWGPAKKAYPEYDWGALAVWAWGGMRVIDYLCTLPAVDGGRILVTGHSRGGKTALLTGAWDERVAVCVPNASGGGGFQCWRFPIYPGDPPGVNRHESLDVMSRLRTYWLHPGLAPFAAAESRLPFDQHFLAALLAPRPLCAVESMDDVCGTPICVQRTFLAAREVYAWMGAADRIGLSFRARGGHAQGSEDWEALLDFADRFLIAKPVGEGRRFDELPCPGISKGYEWEAPVRPARKEKRTARRVYPSARAQSAPAK
jgi:hypothetical protein